MVKEKKLWFAVGDSVVYPGYGVGTVEGIEERVMGDRTRSFCILLVKDKDSESKIMLPLDNVDEVRLRKLSSKSVIKESLGYLSNGEPHPASSWRGRYAAHGNMLTEGDLPSVAHVLKALYIINTKKPLSFREKKMYQKALQLLISEVSERLKQSREAVEKDVMKRLSSTGS